LLSNLAASLGDADAAQELLPLLEPYAGQLIVLSIGNGTMGASDRFIGMLLSTLGQHQSALGRLHSALVFEQQVGARSHAVHTLAWTAKALRAAGRSEDADLAQQESDACGADLGIVPLRV
jgi:hypothetical protein